MTALLARLRARLSLQRFLVENMMRLQGVIAEKDEIIAGQLAIINRQRETLETVVGQRELLRAQLAAAETKWIRVELEGESWKGKA